MGDTLSRAYFKQNFRFCRTNRFLWLTGNY